MRRSRRSVAMLTASATPSTRSATRASSGAAAHSSVKLPERAAQLLRADVVLVPVRDLTAGDAARVEPGAVRGPEVLDEPRLPLPDDGGVLAADLAGADHQIAVLSPADHESVLHHPLQLDSLGIEQHQLPGLAGQPGE